MKLKKPDNKMSVRQRASDDVFEDVISKFEANSSYVARKFVGRQEVIELIYTAFLLGKHVMLEGPPGVAKSKLVHAVFETIKGSSQFYTMMMPNTTPETLFGPIDMKAFRERSEIVYNTKGMLPCANLAFIDEVYRGPDTILGSMLNILNERIFANGASTIECPLITAVGTTYFQSDSHIVEAFKDRWLFHFLLNPLSERAERLSLIQLADEGVTQIEPPEPLTLTDIRKFKAHIRHVHLTDEQRELYDDLVTNFAVKCAAETGASQDLRECGKRISDRRLVEGVEVLKLGKILDEYGTSDDTSDDVSMFAVLKFVLCKGTKSQYEIFDEVCSRVIGGSITKAQEMRELNTFMQVATKLIKSYDDSMPQQSKAALLLKVNKALNVREAGTDGDEDDGVSELIFSDPELAARYDSHRAKLKELQLELTKSTQPTL